MLHYGLFTRRRGTIWSVGIGRVDKGVSLRAQTSRVSPSALLDNVNRVKASSHRMRCGGVRRVAFRVNSDVAFV